MAKNEPVKAFQLLAGNTALDLANTLDFRFRESGPDELLATYDDLLRFTRQSELTPARLMKHLGGSAAKRTRVLARVKELREALASVAYALAGETPPVAADLAILEVHFKEAAAERNLSFDQDRLVWHWPPNRTVRFPLWLLQQEAAELLLFDRAAHIRTCAADSCRWLFLDTTKNHTRRWCDMKVCGNRMKARKFQARLAGEQATPPRNKKANSIA